MGLRGRACPICADAALSQQVNALLESGTGPGAIAKVVPIGKDSIARHKKHAFQPVVPDDVMGTELEMSDQRLQRWLQRSEEMFQASAGQGDLRMAVESVRSGLRAETEWRRRHERSNEQASPDESLPPHQRPLTIEALDALVRQAHEAGGTMPCPLCLGLGTTTKAKVAERLPLLEAQHMEESYENDSTPGNERTN